MDHPAKRRKLNHSIKLKHEAKDEETKDAKALDLKKDQNAKEGEALAMETKLNDQVKMKKLTFANRFGLETEDNPIDTNIGEFSVNNNTNEEGKEFDLIMWWKDYMNKRLDQEDEDSEINRGKCLLPGEEIHEGYIAFSFDEFFLFSSGEGVGKRKRYPRGNKGRIALEAYDGSVSALEELQQEVELYSMYKAGNRPNFKITVEKDFIFIGCWNRHYQVEGRYAYLLSSTLDRKGCMEMLLEKDKEFDSEVEKYHFF